MGALDIMWSLLGSNLKKAAGRVYADSPSMPIASTGGGSKPYRRNPWKLVTSPTSVREAYAGHILEGQNTDDDQDVPEVEPHAGAGRTPDWGAEEYERYFASLPLGVGDAVAERPRGRYSKLKRNPEIKQKSVGVLRKLGETSTCPKCGATRRRHASCPKCDPTSIE